MDLLQTETDEDKERFKKNEDLRRSALSSIPDMKNISLELSHITERLHASWLFHPWGRPALVSMCESLSSISSDKEGSWYDVAGTLGISFEKRECIFFDQSGRDKSQLCLMTFAQYRNSTLDQIMTVLDKVKRYDALARIKAPIDKLVKAVKSHIDNKVWEIIDKSSYDYITSQDNGYISLQDANGTRLDIIRPKGFNKLRLHLPVTLCATPTDELHSLSNEEQIVAKKLDSIKSAAKEDAIYQQSHSTTGRIKHGETPCTQPQPIPYKKTVFLTFSSDGEQSAYRIAALLRKPSSKRAPFGVLILDENTEFLHRNPEELIPTLFNQVDYVMPIITKGYLEALSSSSTSTPTEDMFTSLDVRYIHYIHNLMSRYYVRNLNMNDKFRCVIADVDKDNDANIRSIVNNNFFRFDPTLSAWTYESKLEMLAQQLMKWHK